MLLIPIVTNIIVYIFTVSAEGRPVVLCVDQYTLIYNTPPSFLKQLAVIPQEMTSRCAFCGEVSMNTYCTDLHFLLELAASTRGHRKTTDRLLSATIR